VFYFFIRRGNAQTLDGIELEAALFWLLLAASEAFLYCFGTDIVYTYA
jgi:hypothetical protein